MLQEEIPGTEQQPLPPRATLVLPAGACDNRTGIWMGGAHSLRGQDVGLAQMPEAWLVETAGEMPAAFHRAALRTVFCVFGDLEEVPSVIDRIRTTAASVAEAVRTATGGPRDVYIVCSQGLNRSGLVTGLVLRHLGIPGEEAVAVIRGSRPGALANHAFESLVLGPLDG